MTKQLLSSLILLISIPTILLSQKYPFKTGKISMEEMEMDSCSFYPEANSMIIAKYGDLRFQYDSEAAIQDGSCSRELISSGKKIKYVCTFRLNDGKYSVAHYEDFQKFVQSVREADQERFVLLN